MGPVVTVSGSVGGIGASTFAFALALQAGLGAVLIDGCQGLPLDLLIGAEARAGARWGQVRIRTADIEPDTVRAALPEHLGVRVLSTEAAAVPDAIAITHLVQALAKAPGAVVVDLPARDPLRSSLQPDLDVLLLPPTVHGVAAARMSVRSATNPVVVRTGAADVAEEAIAGFIGVPIGHVVRWQRSVALAATAGAPPPAQSDVMMVAARLLGGLADA